MQLERIPVRKEILQNGYVHFWKWTWISLHFGVRAAPLGAVGTCHCTTVFHDSLAQSVEKSSVQCKLQEKFTKKVVTKLMFGVNNSVNTMATTRYNLKPSVLLFHILSKRQQHLSHQDLPESTGSFFSAVSLECFSQMLI